jgi:cation transporter-like permease
MCVCTPSYLRTTNAAHLSASLSSFLHSGFSTCIEHDEYALTLTVWIVVVGLGGAAVVI